MTPTSDSAVQRRISSLDGLRGLTMLMVFLFHVWEFSGHPEYRVWSIPFGKLFGALHIRVDLFVVLSGFGLMYSYSRNKDRWNVKYFFRRRWWRLGPAYYVSIIFLLLLPNALVVVTRLAGMPSTWQEIPSVFNILTHLTFTHALFNDTWAGIQGAYWSIGLEAQLYVLFVLFVLLLKRINFVTLVLVSMCLCIVFLITGSLLGKGHVWALSGPGRMFHFMCGIVAAVLAPRSDITIKRYAYALLTFIPISQLKATLAIPEIIPFTEVTSGIGFGALLYLASNSGVTARLFESRWLVYLGTVSYSVFLIHQNVSWYVGEFFKKVVPIPDGMLMVMYVTIAFPICLLLGIVLNRLVEIRYQHGLSREKLT